MSLEVWTTIASVGTFIVIAATAIAALVQLRHMRSNNQIAWFTEFRESLESDQFVAARQSVEDLLSKLSDPAVRKALTQGPLPAQYAAISRVGNLFNSVGLLVKHGAIDADLACNALAGPTRSTWYQLRPITALLRRRAHGIWEDFEYMAVLSEDFIARHRGTAYPSGVRRLHIEDRWLSEDTEAGIIPPSS